VSLVFINGIKTNLDKVRPCQGLKKPALLRAGFLGGVAKDYDRIKLSACSPASVNDKVSSVMPP